MTKRHPRRKIHRRHDLGEHAGLNMLWASRGCKPCQADVAEVIERQNAAIREAREFIDPRSEVLYGRARGGGKTAAMRSEP